MYCVFYRIYCLSHTPSLLNPYAKSFEAIETAKIWVTSDRKKAKKFSLDQGMTIDYEDGSLDKNGETAYASLVVSEGDANSSDYKQYIIRWDIVPLE